MTIAEKKTYLQQYSSILNEIEGYLEERERWRTLATKITPTLSDMPKGGNNESRLVSSVEHIVSIDNRIENKIKDLRSMRENIDRAVSELEDSRYRQVIYNRFILNKRWDIIADTIGYDERWTRRLCEQALAKINL